MSKRLTPCTIVPPELYVIREADKQLRNVLRDMGRPGYILVARQMGKTNLLLNAKREIEGPDNAVIYIDLSAPFESERECFRHIIDTALETGPEGFAKCETQISGARKAPLLPSYKEHENELRLLLGAISGKLVIILDEIDSLTKTSFSDKIFAQIRSVYFSRTNYPQFNQLTYVLSGVVEPNEIIKDKKISPFNIGEKIYLDDFNYEQFLDFLSRAGLDLTDQVAERIYYWANGNPRLTWDICFDIEEKRAAGNAITIGEIDDSVKKLYLKDFARAPIDHIREVVTVDDELRSAITVIKYGKGNALPDTTKNKLYLAGIIRSAANYGEITIKNRIIGAALSDQWLLDITVTKKGLAKLAQEQYDGHKYVEALAFYQQLVKNPDTTTKEKDSAYWYMGLCAYHIGQYPAALEYLEKTHWDKVAYAHLYFERAFYIGACHLQSGNVPASRAQFQETLTTPIKDGIYFGALVNIAATYSAEKDFARAIELYRDAVTSIDGSSLTMDDRIRLKTSALYNMAKAYDDMGDQASARLHYQEALDIASVNQQPTILLAMSMLLPMRKEKEQLLTQCVDLIISNNLHPDSSQPFGTLGLTEHVLYGLLRETYIVSRSIFDRLFTFASTLEELKTSNAELLLTLAYQSTAARDIDTAIRMARLVVEKEIAALVVNKDTEFQSYRLLSLLCKGQERKRHQLKYVECLKAGFEPKSIDSVDLEIFVGLAAECIESKKPSMALEYIDFAKPYKQLIHQDQLYEFAAVGFYEMVALRDAKSWSKLRQSSEETLEFLSSLNGCPKNARLVSAEGLKQIEDFARSNLRTTTATFKAVFTAALSSRSAKKYGRNERVSVRYNDGTIKHGQKYKNVEPALADGSCVILNQAVEEDPKNPC